MNNNVCLESSCLPFWGFSSIPTLGLRSKISTFTLETKPWTCVLTVTLVLQDLESGQGVV